MPGEPSKAQIEEAREELLDRMVVAWVDAAEPDPSDWVRRMDAVLVVVAARAYVNQEITDEMVERLHDFVVGFVTIHDYHDHGFTIKDARAALEAATRGDTDD